MLYKKSDHNQRKQLELEIAMLKAELTKIKKEVKSAESLKTANYFFKTRLIDRTLIFNESWPKKVPLRRVCVLLLPQVSNHLDLLLAVDSRVEIPMQQDPPHRRVINVMLNLIR